MVTASQRRGNWRAHRAVAWVLALAVVPLASFGLAWLLVSLLHGQRAPALYRLLVLFLEFGASPVCAAAIGWAFGFSRRQVLWLAILSFVAFFVWLYVIFGALVWTGVLVSPGLHR